MRRFLILTSMLLGLSILPGINAAQAQDPAKPQPAVAQEPPVADTAPPTTGDAAAPAIAAETKPLNKEHVNYKLDESKFVDPSYENLARLYWNLGILDINDNDLIDNYLAITDCEIYQTYKTNDLEWREIRDLARASIRRNYKSWPTSFRVIIPLYLRDYHEDEEYFDVDTKLSVVNAARRIETLFYKKPVTCRKSGEINGYPRNLVLFLNRPFSLPEVPVERELARLFLDEVNVTNKKENDNAVKGLKDAKGLRMTYLEIFFKVHSFKEVINTQAGLQAVVFTQIDHIRVFADIDKEKMLYEQSMFEESKRKRRKREGMPVTDEELNLPSGPLFGEPPQKKK